MKMNNLSYKIKPIMKRRNILLYLSVLTFVLSCFTIDVFAQPRDVLIDMCASKAGDDATYLKDFVVDLDAANPGERSPIAKFSMVLSKSTVYRLSVCNADDSPGEAIIKLFDTKRMIASSYVPSSGKLFDSFDFQCDKTGVYHIFISFKDGKQGSAIGILSFVKKL